MMRRKIIIVLTITFMVTLMVTSFSLLYLSQILRLRLTNAYESSTRLAQQLAYTIENDVPDLTSTPIDTSDPAALHKAVTNYLPTDVNLLNNLESAVGQLAIRLRRFHRQPRRQGSDPHQCEPHGKSRPSAQRFQAGAEGSPVGPTSSGLPAPAFTTSPTRCCSTDQTSGRFASAFRPSFCKAN